MKLNKIAFGIALAAGVTAQAQANDLFFPMVVNSPSVATLLSIANTATTPGYADDELYVALNYKTTDDLAANCNHLDGNLRSSLNDLMTIDLNGHFGNLLFGDPSGPSAIVADTYQNIGTYRGYVMVSDLDYTATDVDPSNRLYGEAMIVDFQTGASWGYVGWNTQTNVTASGWTPMFTAGALGGVSVAAEGATGTSDTATQADLDAFGATNGNYLSSPYAYRTYRSTQSTRFFGDSIGDSGSVVTLMPPSQVTTKLFVTPVGATRQQMWDPQTNGQARVVVRLGPAGNNTMFDRDEVPRSFSNVANVTCVGSVDVWKDLIPAALSNSATSWGAKGGFSDIRVAATPLNRTPGQLDTVAEITSSVMKLEYGAALDGKSVGSGMWNNAYQLIAPVGNIAPAPAPVGDVGL